MGAALAGSLYLFTYVVGSFCLLELVVGDCLIDYVVESLFVKSCCGKLVCFIVVALKNVQYKTCF